MENFRKKVCILSFSNLKSDSRVLREIELCRQFYDVDVIGYGVWEPPIGVNYYQQIRRKVFPIIKYFLLFGGTIFPKLYDIYFWLKPQYRNTFNIIKRGGYDLVHANDWDTLPIVGKYQQKKIGNSRILFDAHEYNLDLNQTVIFKKIYQRYRYYLFKKYGNSVKDKITVAESIKNLYIRNFKWEFDVILNAPNYLPIIFKKSNIKEIHLVHHGGALPARYIEEMMKIIKFLKSNYFFHLFLVPGDQKYLSFIKDYAKSISNNIIMHDPIKPTDIVRVISNYDIGIPLLKVDKESYYQSLPNKFFDYIMAGLMVVVSPLPMMMQMIDKYKVGLYSNDQSPETMANLIMGLSSKTIDKYKQNSLKAAKKLNAEAEMKKLKRIYDSLMSK